MYGQSKNGIQSKPTLVSGSDIPSVSVDSFSIVTYLELSAGEEESGEMETEGLDRNIPWRLEFLSSSETSLMEDLVDRQDDVWRNDVSNNGMETTNPITDNKRYEGKQNKAKEKSTKRVNPPTIGVMFVDQQGHRDLGSGWWS